MATVAETKEIFGNKGLNLNIPIQDDFEVKNIDIVERHTVPGGRIFYLLKITYYDEKGKEAYDLFPCEGKVEKKRPLITITEKTPVLLTLEPLPLRDVIDFESEDEALKYITEAFIHLLKDKGYSQAEDEDGCDLHFKKEARGFFINITARCDEKGLDRAEELIKLRGKHGSGHDYGLVFPAIQESLGLIFLSQENFFRWHGEFLSAHRIGAYGVNNSDPNMIFPFTIYPKERELARYFMFTVQQWQLLRNKYLASRKKGD